jgi:hypothetical protein
MHKTPLIADFDDLHLRRTSSAQIDTCRKNFRNFSASGMLISCATVSSAASSAKPTFTTGSFGGDGGLIEARYVPRINSLLIANAQHVVAKQYFVVIDLVDERDCHVARV